MQSKKGLLVLFVDADAPRTMWGEASVTDLYTGLEGYVRKAVVGAACRLLSKDIRIICLL